ncbi:hypothetical protein Tco_1406635 [Tanacetum coccineum]
MVAYLQKSKGSEGFHQIVDFLTASHISTLENGDMEITATIDGKVKVVSDASIRRHLKLEDSDGISDLPTTKNFEQLALMGSRPRNPTHLGFVFDPLNHPIPCVGSIVDLEVLLIELEVGIVDCFWTADMGISIMCELDAQPIPPYEGDMVKIRSWVNSGHSIRKHVNVLGTCGELDAFVSIPDEGDMTFLRKKGKSGAAVGKLVLLQVIKAKDLELETKRRKLRLRMNFVKIIDFHSSKTMSLYFVEHLCLVNFMLGQRLHSELAFGMEHVIPTSVVIEGEVLYKFRRFLGALVTKLSTCGVVNFTLKRVRDIIIENLDLESKIYAMMRDFLKPESMECTSVLHKLDGVRLQRYHIVSFEELNGVSIALVAWSGTNS